MTRAAATLCLLLLCHLPRSAAGEMAKGAGAPTDKAISVSLESADLRAVVTSIARALNINIVGGDQLSGTVTVRLNKAPGLSALEAILKNAGFALVREEGGFFQVVPLTRRPRAGLEAEQARQRIQIRIFPLRFAEVERVAKLLVPNALSDEKSIAKDPDSRQLIISGTAEDLEKAERIIKAIDKPPPQVAIQARIVEVYTDRAKKMGLKVDLAKTTAKVNPLDGTVKTITQTYGFDLSQAMAADDTFTFTLVGDKVGPGVAKGITATLDALVQKEVAEVLSAPNVTTSHGREAVMKVIDQVPVVTRSTTQVVDQVTVTDEKVEFKETGVTLTVTPRVLADDKIAMLIEPTVLELTGWTDTDPPQPIIDERSTKTEVVMTNGQWLIIGGMIRYRERKLVRGIPLLKDIPVLGALFRTTRTRREKSNLIIVVSARVLTDRKIDNDVEDLRDRLRRHRRAHGLWPSREPLFPLDKGEQ